MFELQKYILNIYYRLVIIHKNLLIFWCFLFVKTEKNNCGSYPSRTNPIDWQNELQDCANAFKKLCDATWEEQLNDKEWKRLKKDAFEKLHNIIDDLWI